MPDIAELLKDESKWRDGWKQRGGWPMRVLCADGPNANFPVLAIDEQGFVTQFTASGKCTYAWDGPHDLIPRPVKRRKFLPIYKCSDEYHTGSLFDTKPTLGLHVVACIEIEFEEGQGLQ